MAMLVLLGLSACGGGEKGATARPLPEEAKALRPGGYHSQEFKPSLSFRVGKGWTADLEMSDALAIRQGADVEGERALLSFATVKQLYKPGSLNVTKAPDRMAGWYQHHPYLRSSKPEPVTVGGVEGVRFDVVVEDLPKDHYGACGSGCVDLFKLSGDHTHVIFKGEKQRLIVLKDVRGEPVTIVFASKASKFHKFWPEAEKVVGSVKWEGS
jgi:hypothetical protein